VDRPVGRGTAGPDDAAEVTAAQVRWVLDRLIQASNAARAASAAGTIGRPPKHGSGFHLADPTTWPDPQTTTIMATRCGTAVTCARALQHPWLTRRAA
jgi:hypothetical protein